MKIDRVSEKIENKNFSSMKNWGKDRLKETYAGIKTINYELGAKVIELLAEYNLGIMSIDDEDWCKSYGVLMPGEQNYKEYRVNIGRIPPWEDFWDEYCYENDTDLDGYDDLPDDEQEKIKEIFLKQKPKEFSNYQIVFSVFLPKKVDNLKEAAMADASSYLRLLYESNLTTVTNGGSEYSVFDGNADEVIDFINRKHIIITNKNLKDVRTISYRLYKDSKAFSAFELNMGGEFKQFFNEWEKLL